MGRTVRVGAAGELADDLQRPLQGKDAVEAVVADVQGALAQRASLLFDGENVGA